MMIRRSKADREGADRLEQQLDAMLSLVMPREGWHPPVVRTMASENRGIDVLAGTIDKFREHFASRGKRELKHVEYWKKRLVEMLQSRVIEKFLGGAACEELLVRLAGEVAGRRMNPFSAVNEIVAKSGMKN